MEVVFPVDLIIPAEASSSRRWENPWTYAMVAGFLLAVLFSSRLLSDPDLGYHLMGGKWILDHKCFPVSDSFTYTVSNHKYLDIHWLYQVFLYLIYMIGGYSFICIVNILLILLLIYLVWKRIRQSGASEWLCIVLLLAVLLTSEFRFWARPETLSWIFMNFLLLEVEKRNGKIKSCLYLIPFIMLAWANVEGLFAIGLVILGMFILSSSFHSRKIDFHLLKYFGWSLLACLVNPYFFHGFIFPFDLLKTVASSNVFKSSIFEFQSSWTLSGLAQSSLSPGLFIYKLFSVCLILMLLATLRKRKIHEVLLIFIFLYLSAAAIRNIPLYMIACAPHAGIFFQDLKHRWLKNFNFPILKKTILPLAFTILIGGLCLRVSTGAYYIPERWWNVTGLGLNRDFLPERACVFLKQNHLDGRVLNPLESGSWMDWQGQQKTFIDGRLEVMGREFFKEYMTSFSLGGLKPLADKYHANIICYIPLESMQWQFELSKLPDWRPVYMDGSSVIFLRKGYLDLTPGLDYEKILAQNGISKDITRKAHELLQMPLPSAWNCFWKDFVVTPDYPQGLHSLALFSLMNNRSDAAEAFYLEALRRSQGRYPEFYHNLEFIYSRSNRKDLALLCAKRMEGLKR